MKKRMHAEYFGGTNMRYTPENGKTIYKTSCWQSVDGSQIAAFEDGITCKKCIANLASRREWEIEWAERRARKVQPTT